MQPSRLDPVEHKSFEGMRCSVAQCLEVIGEWWTMLVVRDAFFGVRRFDEFQERLGISRNVLTQRLAKLVAAGVFDKRPYQDNPPRYDYVLTDKGRDLWPVLTTLRQWGDKHAASHGPPVQLEHLSCGANSALVLTCEQCGERVGPRDVRAHGAIVRKRGHASASPVPQPSAAAGRRRRKVVAKTAR
jgi:DNA-binding HxlR family transcriptional regulator